MTTSLILTVIADDQPGIVERLAATINASGGNWLESRMSHMAGKFAGILRVEIAEQHSNQLISALSALGESGLIVNAETSTSGSAELATPVLQLKLIGNDRPGIVKEVSQALAQLGVNVLEFASNCNSAEHTAIALFKAEASLQLPTDMTEDNVRDALEALSDDLMVELTV